MMSITMTGTPTSCLTCRMCGCNGLQYDPYRNAWYCPVFSGKEVADNKTIPQDAYFSNVTTSIEHV